jgi:hypothetical protein
VLRSWLIAASTRALPNRAGDTLLHHVEGLRALRISSGPSSSKGAIAMFLPNASALADNRRSGWMTRQTRVRYRYRRVHVPLRRDCWVLGQNKTRRNYRELGLQLRNKTPKRRVKAKLRGRPQDRQPTERDLGDGLRP